MTAPPDGVVAGQPVLQHHGAHGDPYAAGPAFAKQVPEPETGYRDVAFAVAFVVHFIAILFMAFGMGVPALNAAADAEDGKVDPAGHQVSVEVASESSIVGMLVVAALCGGAFSLCWLIFLQRNAASIIKCSLWTSIVCQGVGAIIAFAFNVGLGLILLFCALLTAWYAYAVRDRIEFASENLKTATAAVRMYPATVAVAFGALLVQLVWVVIWALAFYGVQSETEDDGNFSEVLMLVSLFWGQQVIQNIVHCTTSGTVASWWFSGETVAKPTMGALTRACTTSFGSIALGSLVVAVLKTLRVLARRAEREARSRGGGAGLVFAACISRWLIGCLERLMEYFNKWAFCYVAIYGQSFRTAGSNVFKLFKERGWTTIINDDLTDMALTIGCLVVGVFTGLVGAGWAAAEPLADGSWIFASAFISLLIGFFMCCIVTTVITSAVATVFVCWAENPEALAATHPEHLEALMEAWRKFHGEEIAACGYTARFAHGGGAV